MLNLYAIYYWYNQTTLYIEIFIFNIEKIYMYNLYKINKKKCDSSNCLLISHKKINGILTKIPKETSVVF
jgi:hypothetical protein